MKITLDVDRLVQEGRITPEECARLKELAAKDTGSLAINILIGFGVIAVAGGLVALFQSMEFAIGLGLLMGVCGVLLGRGLPEWSLLGAILLLVGALTASGGIIALTNGATIGFLWVAVLCLVGSILAKSGLLAALVPCALLATVGGMTGYSHAAYFLCIEQPAMTIGLFSALGLATYYLSQQLNADYGRLAIIFSRMCLLIVNFGFWIGSLWGDSLRKDRTGWVDPVSRILPDWAFALGWAAGLLAVGVWAAKRNKRFVVNVVATFGAIHLYTQWFERLGATPASVLIAGLMAIAIAVGMVHYNRRSELRLAVADS